MADPISIASGVIALVSFSVQTSKALHQAVESIKKHPKVIRELKKEVEDLQQVLEELKEVVENGASLQLSSLSLPLRSCGIACKDFADTIYGCTKNTTEAQGSLRDWAKMKYLGGDISSFKETIGSYKSTIQIALGGMNLRTLNITTGLLQEYGRLISDTKLDLQDRLEHIDEKLKCVPRRHENGAEVTGSDRIQEEKDSILRCLEICAEVSTCISQQQPKVVKGTHITPDENIDFSAATSAGAYPSDRLTVASLGKCEENMTSAKLELQTRLREIDRRLKTAPAEDHDRIQEQKASIQACLEICGAAATETEKARVNVFEDVGAAEDSQQMIVSTIGDLISARRVTVGARSMQVMGQMTDDSLQCLSLKGKRYPVVASMNETGEDETAKFEERHGTGRNLCTP